LLNNCDDEGRISSSADYLAYELYPHEITWPGTAELIASIPAWLHILEAGGLIQTYNHTVAVVGWPERYLAERIDHHASRNYRHHRCRRPSRRRSDSTSPATKWTTRAQAPACG